MTRRWAVDPEHWRPRRPEDTYNVVIEDEPSEIVATDLSHATAEDIVTEHNAMVDKIEITRAERNRALAAIARVRDVPHGVGCFSRLSASDPCDCARDQVHHALDGGVS